MKDRKPGEKAGDQFLSKLQWLMFYRAIVVTLLLGATALIQYEGTHFLHAPAGYLYFLIGVTYGLTLVYALLLRWIKRLKVFAYGQILGDLVFITLLIYVTGGSESIFSWVYILSIFGASTILYRRGGLLVASFSSILYGALLDLEYYQILFPHRSYDLPTVYQGNYVFYLLSVNMVAFFLVAILSAYLAEQVRRKEEELTERLVDYSQLERLYKHIVQNATSGLVTVDETGRVTSFNRMAERITGLRLEEIYHEEAGKLFPGLLEWALSLGWRPEKGWGKLQFSRWETEFQRNDGGTLSLGFSVSPLKDSTNREIGSILIFQDLTRLREMERELKMADRLAAVGTLAAGMAHEIRNPLASINGAIEILKEDLGKDETHQQLLDIILRETDRLNSLVADFLLFARPTSPGKYRVHLNRVAEEVLKVFTHSPECRPEIRLRTDFCDDLFWVGDEQHMKQILWNLLVNAVQAMPNGGEISVELSRTAPQLPFAGEPAMGEIAVTDTGDGISEENIPRIFDPFFTTKEAGTGLGLSIVHNIADNYGGRIKVHSLSGKGTTLTVCLPVQPAG